MLYNIVCLLLGSSYRAILARNLPPNRYKSVKTPQGVTANESALAEIEKLLVARKSCKTMLLKTEILLSEEKRYADLDERFKAWFEKRDM